VLYPTLALKELGLWHPVKIGHKPSRPYKPGLGRLFSTAFPFPVLTEPAKTSTEIDELSILHDSLFQDHTTPVFQEVMRILSEYLMPASRILLPNSGSGEVALHLAALVPAGEVVGMDSSAERVQESWLRARKRGFGNLAFFQSSDGYPPTSFTSKFDLVFISLTLSDHRDLKSLLASLTDAVVPGGYVVVTGTSPDWLERFQKWLGPLGIPDWLPDSADPIKEMATKGSANVYWEEVLPGIFASLLTRAHRVTANSS
jgi:SAM-dependent methyltransferase